MVISQKILDSQTSLSDVIALANDQCIKHRNGYLCELFCFTDKSRLYIVNNKKCEAYLVNGDAYTLLSEKIFP